MYFNQDSNYMEMSIFVKRRPYLGLIITILLITLIYVPYQNLNSRAQAAVDCNANIYYPSRHCSNSTSYNPNPCSNSTSYNSNPCSNSTSYNSNPCSNST